VLAALVQTALALVALLAFALLLGYRPDAGVAGWVGAVGVLLLLAIALTWLCLALGLASGSVETASNTPLFLVLLPFLSSGFVPTDSMPAGLAWIAEHQPFTPLIDTLRACLAGTSPGTAGWWAVGWCVLITIASYAWARRLFSKVRAG
jgi:ABC-2 type transport system permease protein